MHGEEAAAHTKPIKRRRLNPMTESKCGSQTIGCKVTSCRYNLNDCLCELSRIEVEPRRDCHSEDCDESLCGSYRAK